MPERSRLVPVGVVLLFVGLIGGTALRSVGNGMHGSPWARTVISVSDWISLLFFLGIGMAVVGWRRNRQARREAARS